MVTSSANLWRVCVGTIACLAVAAVMAWSLTGCTVVVSEGGGGGGRTEPADGGDTDDQGDDDDGGGGQTDDGDDAAAQTVETGLLQGKVTSAAGAVLGGVAVTAGTAAAPVVATTTTNEQGYYTIDNLEPVGRMFVVYELAGYAQSARITEIQEGLSSFIEVALTPVETSQAVPAADGGAVATNTGAEVTLPPNGLVDASGAAYTGTATVNLTAFDPSTEAGIAAFPGAFEGVLEDGSIVPFSSYGFVDATITDPDGNPLNLAEGAVADLTVPIPAALVEAAPDTIDLWFFDDTDGQWHQEGTATKNGTVYEGQVSHFTPWNCDDQWSGFSGVIGRVIDCLTGEPIRGARVVVQGLNWTATEESTGDDGTFSIAVPVDEAAVVYAEKDGVRGENVPITTLPGSSPDPLDVGDICLNTPRMQITLVWGQEPADLDAHLTYPADGDTRGHVYFDNRTHAEANLDTDDITSFGPEIITVFGLTDGLYRYSVHHYAGSEVISASEARVTLVIGDPSPVAGVYTQTPPGGAAAVKDAWRVWEITVEDGVVSEVRTSNQYFNDVDHTDTTVFRVQGR